jgi:fumarylacetoacetate (FAA) hydrolase
MRLVTCLDGEDARVGELEDDRVELLKARRMLDRLAGEGPARTGESRPLSSVRLLAPVPEPPSVRDFYAYEGHVAAGAARRGRGIAPYWYEAPAFYFSNPAAIHGSGEPVRRPASTSMLDFELEIAAVIGLDGRGEPEIAGFALMNDWSARDVQASEVTVGLGPAKAKDFAISLGPWLVTPDELPYREGRLHVQARVELNGEEIASGDAAEKHFTWPDLVAHAARDTRLRPGDVLGSGTLAGGSLWELDTGRWIEPGDVVALEAEGLGRLETPVI